MWNIRELPDRVDEKSDLIVDSLINSLEDNLDLDIYTKFKNGYGEMSEINLTLAEFGLEEDMYDLNMYEVNLGCDI